MAGDDDKPANVRPESAADRLRRLIAPERALTPAQKLRIACELHDAAVEMVQATLRREHPDADDAEQERRLIEWLQMRPGAEQGDGVGRVVPWPRHGTHL